MDKHDDVNNPKHYDLFPDQQVIDVIQSSLTADEFAGYCKGNALKYRLRAGEKGDALKCIAKANWYQKKLREVSEERNGGWTPEAINEAAFKDAYKEYTLQEVLGNATLPSWARWVVVTNIGMVVICELEPVPHSDSGLWEFAGAFELVNKVVPPISFKNCIWEVNVKPDCEYTLEQVIGDAELSDWARWVAVDKDGEVYEYSDRPCVASHPDLWDTTIDCECSWIKDIEPPLDFTKCIWEVKK